MCPGCNGDLHLCDVIPWYFLDATAICIYVTLLPDVPWTQRRSVFMWRGSPMRPGRNGDLNLCDVAPRCALDATAICIYVTWFPDISWTQRRSVFMWRDSPLRPGRNGDLYLCDVTPRCALDATAICISFSESRRNIFRPTGAFWRLDGTFITFSTGNRSQHIQEGRGPNCL